MHFADKKSRLYIVKEPPQKVVRPDKPSFALATCSRLKRARKDTRFSQTAVGAVIGISGNTYSKYEKHTMLPVVYWAAVCEKLYLDPWQLLTGRPHKPFGEIPVRDRAIPKPKPKRA